MKTETDSKVARIAGLAVALLAALVSTGCRRESRHTISVVGSTSIEPFAEMLAEEFDRRNSTYAAEVQGGGSTFGLQAVANGIADIGMCSRDLKPDEHFTPTVIARDGVAVVVPNSNPVNGLTTDQIRDLFAGRIANWKDVGGSNMRIWLVTREEGSGTREAFVKLVMGKQRISTDALVQVSNGAVKELVRHNPGAVGFMSLGQVGHDLKALAVDGVEATGEQVLRGRYPLVRPFLFVVQGEPGPGARQFIDFVLTASSQAMLEQEGLVRAK